MSLTYRPRRPESTVLHAVVREHLETFLAERREGGGEGCPRFLEESFRRYLRCGVLCHGFARVRCEGCGEESLLGFSCKSRVCPSCLARRMSETAAYLRDALARCPIPLGGWVTSVYGLCMVLPGMTWVPGRPGTGDLRRMLLIPLVLALAVFYTFGVESFACHDHGTETADRPCAVCHFGTTQKPLLPDTIGELVAPESSEGAIRPAPLRTSVPRTCLSVRRLRAPPTV